MSLFNICFKSHHIDMSSRAYNPENSNGVCHQTLNVILIFLRLQLNEWEIVTNHFTDEKFRNFHSYIHEKNSWKTFLSTTELQKSWFHEFFFLDKKSEFTFSDYAWKFTKELISRNIFWCAWISHFFISLKQILLL